MSEECVSYKKYLTLWSMLRNIQIMRATLVSTSPAEILKRIYRELDITMEILNESTDED